MRKAHIKIDWKTICCQNCPLAIYLGLDIPNSSCIHIGLNKMSFKNLRGVKVFCAYAKRVIEDPISIPDWCPFLEKAADDEKTER